jgi:hypothetical protein
VAKSESKLVAFMAVTATRPGPMYWMNFTPSMWPT